MFASDGASESADGGRRITKEMERWLISLQKTGKTAKVDGSLSASGRAAIKHLSLLYNSVKASPCPTPMSGRYYEPVPR
jgi:hypothetical protein